MKYLKQFLYKYKSLIKSIIPKTWIDFAQLSIVKRAKWKFDQRLNKQGVNYIGIIQGMIGLGQSCRLIAHALNDSSIPFTIFNYDLLKTMKHDDHSWDHRVTNTFPYNINLFHLNPPELIHAYLNLGSEVWNSRYNIGYWLWELEDFPQEWLPALNLVDEVWTPAEFISTNLRKYTNKPVHTLTYPMIVETSSHIDRNYFNLPKDKFLFLTMYDCNSTMARKNPIATINAFKRAFEISDKRVGLVIKINNPNDQDIAIIKELLHGHTNVYLIVKSMSKIEVNNLINLCDSLVSLHRAEGYGLPLAEAMTLGKPVIGTNWSANTEFMTKKNSCLVDYKLVRLEKDYSMYKKGSRWAEASIEHASEYMVRLVGDSSFYSEIAVNAKRHMSENYSLLTAAQALNKRILEIYSQ